MDKIKCEVVRDLMPLVADDVASEESKKLVNGHMESCPDCRQVFEVMARRLPSQEETESETKFIRFCRKLEKKMRWQKVVLWILIAVIVGCAGYIGHEVYLYGTSSVSAANVDMSLIADENGWVSAKFTMLNNHPFIDGGMSGYYDHGIYYITLEEPMIKIGYQGEETEFYRDLYDYQIRDGKLCKVITEYDVVYNPDINANVNDYNVSYEEIKEIWLGLPDDKDKKLVWKLGDPIEVDPMLPEKLR